jgi:hypothetical protein
MYLGDIGGLSGILAQIGVILLGYTQFASFFANNFFVSKLYVAKRRYNEDISKVKEVESLKKSLQQKMIEEFSSYHKIVLPELR